MPSHFILIIQKIFAISICIILSMFLISCNSTLKNINQEHKESVIYKEDVTDRVQKKNIIVGEHGGYWTYYEQIKETGCNFNAETDVSDSFCLNESSSEEDHFPDTNSSEPYKCICTAGWRYHSVNGDSSPAMNWNIHFVASGGARVMINRFVPFGGKAHSIAEALSSAKVTCNNVILKSERIHKKVESGKGSPLQANIFTINTQHSGVLPAGTTSIELQAELSALVKAESRAQAGLFCFLPPTKSSAKSNARVSIGALEFLNFHRVTEE